MNSSRVLGCALKASVCLLAVMLILLPVLTQAGDGGRVLSIINAAESREQPRMSKAIALWQKRYPDAEIVFRDVSDVPMLRTALELKDPSIDLVSVQEYMGLCSRELYAAGFLQNLTAIPEIEEQLNHWIPMEGILGMRGGVIGAPQALHPHFWTVNQELFQALGLRIPEPGWTWADFFALGEQLHQLNASQNKNYALLQDASAFPYLLKQYSMNKVDVDAGKAAFDTEQFRTLLASWKGALDKGLIRPGDGFEQGPMPVDVLLRVSRGEYAGLREWPLVLPPVSEGMASYPTQSILLVLNPHSRNHEMAAHFLACYLSPEALLSEDVLTAGKLLKQQFTSPDEQDVLWLQLLARGRQEFFRADVMRPLIAELYPKFVSGLLSADDFARQMQQIADEAMGR